MTLMWRSKLSMVPVAIGTVVFALSVYWIYRHFAWKEIFSELTRANLVLLFGGAACAHCLFIIVRTFRWKVLARGIDQDVTFAELYCTTACTVGLGNLTPGQIAEALKIELLNKRTSTARLPGLGAFAVERVMDFCVVTLVGFAGFLWRIPIADDHSQLAIAGLCVLVFAALSAVAVLRWARRGPHESWLGKVRAGAGSIVQWRKMGLLSIGAWACVAVGWWISLRAVGVTLSIPDTLCLVSIVTLATLASFIPGGLGVSEVVTAELLLRMGASPLAAQAGAISLRAYALVVVLFGLLHLPVVIGIHWRRRNVIRDGSAR